MLLEPHVVHPKSPVEAPISALLGPIWAHLFIICEPFSNIFGAFWCPHFMVLSVSVDPSQYHMVGFASQGFL